MLTDVLVVVDRVKFEGLNKFLEISTFPVRESLFFNEFLLNLPHSVAVVLRTRWPTFLLG